jgi:hypothetical protein
MIMLRGATFIGLGLLALAGCGPGPYAGLDECERAYRARLDAIAAERDRAETESRRKSDSGATSRARLAERADAAARDALEAYRRCQADHQRRP